MAATAYERFAFRVFGTIAEGAAHKSHHLRIALQKAHVEVRPEVYLATSYLNMVLVFTGCLAIVAAAIGGYASGALPVPKLMLPFLVPVPLLLAGLVHFTTLAVPDLKAAARARDIDAKLPYALNYIATLASAGVPPEKVFAGLARQPIYGEVAAEAAWITRDLQLLGMDIVNAFTKAIDRSPSIRLQDFLQGAIAAVTTGGELKQYFLAKAEQFLLENRMEQRKFLDSLAVLAESFVVVVVAVPILFVVLLTVMAAFGGGPGDAIAIGYVLTLLILPLAQFGFATTIKWITPEA